ncbi:MAG TPA: glycosyltransferase family 4 protein [Planctomycetota bacterium]
MTTFKNITLPTTSTLLPESTSTRSDPIAPVLPPGRARLRVAYLTTEYPKASHTFIRREIAALEQRGHSVLRLSIRRSDSALVHPQDRAEVAQTITCLQQSMARILLATMLMAVTRPRAMMRALWMALRMSRASDRGLLRHFAYVAEAAVLLRICQDHGIRHVHVHFGTNAAAVARLMRCLSGRELSYSMTVHGPDEFDSPRGFALRDKVADASFVAAISSFCAAQIRRWAEPADWHKVHVVRCTIDRFVFDGSEPVPSQSRTLVSVGRLTAQKGQMLLIEAMSRLREGGVDARLVLAGDGEMRPQIEKAIRAHGLERFVTITGWIDEREVRSLLLKARALVLPSFVEGLPVAIMEAMAMRRPVIATYVGGIPELVREHLEGWLVPAGSVEALTEAMEEAVCATGKRLDWMGQSGTRRVRERHDPASEIDKLEALLVAAHGNLKSAQR